MAHSWFMVLLANWLSRRATRNVGETSLQHPTTWTSGTRDAGRRTPRPASLPLRPGTGRFH
ncbi:hypothetical protein CGCSCA5_v008148 [Colletotrichum siamense]|nr:hypothetical protein CGCSCA5_v008148 [Colletotrichum siamense]